MPEQPTYASPTDKFRALALEAQPLQNRIAEISLEQMQLSLAITLDALTKAFPDAKVEEVKALAVLKPTDLHETANKTIEAVRAHGYTVKTIQIDGRRQVITILE